MPKELYVAVGALCLVNSAQKQSARKFKHNIDHIGVVCTLDFVELSYSNLIIYGLKKMKENEALLKIEKIHLWEVRFRKFIIFFIVSKFMIEGPNLYKGPKISQ